MRFGLSEEQQELATMVRALLEKRADPPAVRAAIEAEHGYDEQLWSTLVEQVGVAALAVPEEHGGAGFSLFESLVVLQELGRALAPSPLLPTLLVTAALTAGGDADACARLLPRVAGGEPTAFVDLGDGAVGTRPAAVLGGDSATLLVAATDDGLVEVDLATVERSWAESVDQTLRFGRLDLAHAATRPVGDADAARRRVALVGAAATAALQVGLMDRALAMTVAYTKERVQFGRPIGSFQALKHRMADCLVLLEMSRSASWAASYAVATAADDAARLASVARSYCSDAAERVAAETVQLHGGIAITWEHDAHLVLKRAHALGRLFGAAHEHRARVLATLEHPPTTSL